MSDEILNLLNVPTQLQAGQLFFSLIASMLFGFALSKIYQLYFGPNEPSDYSIGVSFLLMMPAVTTIFIVIQYSLPLSLGLLGALSFVRFRTPVKRAEDIAFILLAISISLCCAVYYFHLAIFLLVLVFAYTLLKARFNLSGLLLARNTLVTIRSDSKIEFERIQSSLAEKFGRPTVVNWQERSDGSSAVLSIDGQNLSLHQELLDVLRAQVPQGSTVDIFYAGNELVA